MNGKTVDGKKLKVEEALSKEDKKKYDEKTQVKQNNRKLFVKGFPPTT